METTTMKNTETPKTTTEATDPTLDIPGKERVVTFSNQATDDPSVIVAVLPLGYKAELQSAAMRELEERRERPRSRTGRAQLADIDSLIAYVQRYRSEDTVGFADPGAPNIEVIFDAHPAGEDHRVAGWSRFAAFYGCAKSPDWVAWEQATSTHLSQEQLGDFLDGRRDDVVKPEGVSDAPGAADVIDLSRKLSIVTKGTFKRDVNPETGEYSLVAQQEHDHAVTTKIPPRFFVAIPVFLGGKRWVMEVRLRLSIVDQKPRFRLERYRPDDVYLQAFSALHERIREEAQIPVFLGKRPS
jgi:uncharacterized protein YfdQ (DUF2303 family)